MTTWNKGPLERFFRTVREGLLQYLPGYKGPDINSRGLDVEGHAFFYIDQLEAIVREWIAAVYHHTPSPQPVRHASSQGDDDSGADVRPRYGSSRLYRGAPRPLPGL